MFFDKYKEKKWQIKPLHYFVLSIICMKCKIIGINVTENIGKSDKVMKKV